MRPPSLMGLLVVTAALLPMGSAMGSERAPSPAFASADRSESHPLLPDGRWRGAGTLRYLGIPIYHARLWTHPAWQAEQMMDQALVLELEYLRSLSGRLIADRSISEMARLADIDPSRQERWRRQLQQILPDVTEKDRISGHYRPGEGLTFWYQGRVLGRIDDPEFCRLFIGIWLSPQTSRPDLRQALLGASGSRQP